MRYVLLSALVLALLWIPAEAQDITARIIGITDGDTVHALTSDNHNLRVRLADIDAPEMSQPYGKSAKKALSDLVYGKTVVLEEMGTDRYGRTIAIIWDGSMNVNEEMVREGAAWDYVAYDGDKAMPAIQQEAATAQRGLWALQVDQRIPPWVWRRNHRLHID